MTTPATRSHTTNSVGHLLRAWRSRRGMSQLDLALESGFSARHVSFIETGRTQPSRQALLALADTLDIPLRDRNRLLEAGGYARIYRQTPINAQEMSHVRSLLQFIVDRHMPYPAIVLDRYSTCVLGNEASASLIAAIVDPSLLVEHANFLRIAFHPLGARRFIVNWHETAHHLLSRAERELSSPDDEPGDTLLREIRGYAGPLARRAPAAFDAGDLLLPIHFRLGELELKMFSGIMTLGTPQDVTLQELRVETFFPIDQASEQAWELLRAGTGTTARERVS